MFLVTPSTVRGTAVLRPRRPGAGLLGGGVRVIPRRPLSDPMFWRVMLDQAPLRMGIALAALPLAVALPPGLALTLTPVAMVGGLMAAERTFLATSGPPEVRRGLVERGEAERVLDLLHARGRDALGRIAAARDMEHARLHLVVEQSALARAPILTLVSVQRHDAVDGAPQLMELTEDERRMLDGRLFDGEFDEARLHRVNRAQNRHVRHVPFEAQSVTAHARLMARVAEKSATARR